MDNNLVIIRRTYEQRREDKERKLVTVADWSLYVEHLRDMIKYLKAEKKALALMELNYANRGLRRAREVATR